MYLLWQRIESYYIVRFICIIQKFLVLLVINSCNQLHQKLSVQLDEFLSDADELNFYLGQQPKIYIKVSIFLSNMIKSLRTFSLQLHHQHFWIICGHDEYGIDSKVSKRKLSAIRGTKNFRAKCTMFFAGESVRLQKIDLSPEPSNYLQGFSIANFF